MVTIGKVKEHAVREYLMRSAIPVVEEAEGRLAVGTCTLLERDARRFLVTAEHVADGIKRGEVGVAVGAHGAVHTPGRGTLTWTIEHDVAVMELTDQTFLKEVERQDYRRYLQVGDVHNGPLTHDFLLYGYPASRVKVNGDDLDGEAIMLLIQQLEGSPGTLNRAATANDLFLGWQGDPKMSLQGISGTPVWSIKDTDADLWTPSTCMKLCGVQTSQKQGEWIRATTWDVVEQIIAKLTAPLPS